MNIMWIFHTVVCVNLLDFKFTLCHSGMAGAHHTCTCLSGSYTEAECKYTFFLLIIRQITSNTVVIFQ